MKTSEKPFKSQSDDTEIATPAKAKDTKKANSRPSWKSVMIGGVPGIVLGAAGVAATTSFTARAAEPQTDSVDAATDNATELHIPSDASVASGVNDDMTFGEAFAAAREEVGPGGVFTWHGQLYNTYTQGEWTAAHPGTPLEPAEPGSGTTSNSILEPDENNPEQDPTHQESDDHDQEQDPTHQESYGHDPEQGPTLSSDPDIVIGEFNQIETEGGNIINTVSAEIDGHDAAFIDLDNDGYIDVVAVDVNDNEVLDEGDVIVNVSEQNVHVTDLVTDNNPFSTPEEDIYHDTEDYTNDADASAF